VYNFVTFIQILAKLHHNKLVYPVFLDHGVVTAQLKNTFKDMNEFVDRFGILMPANLLKATDEEIVTSANKLATQYQKFLSSHFAQELLTLRSALKKEINQLSNIADLARMLIVENCTIASSFDNVCTALLLFLAIPVTVASCERSFSKLKIIKNYLCSTICQERLKGLSVLGIECEAAKQINLEKVLDDFAQAKHGRRNAFNRPKL
jgi:hypothetical protein